MIENLDPKQSWALLQQNSNAVLIDVRMAVEHSFIGHPPKAVHIAWKEFPNMQLNTQFIQQVEALVSDKNIPILLLCRSGQRSVAAANALEAVGYQQLINIVEGFEGALDTKQQRSNIDGWKFHQLPWIQS